MREGFSLSSAPGKIVVENITPKATAGKHKIIDEKFTDTAEYKETAEGKIEE